MEDSHMRRLVTLVIGLTMLALGAVLQCPAVRAQEKPAPLKDWEFKAVRIGPNEKEATIMLNDLASEGWHYVGPLGNGLVAFRRHYVPREQLLVEVAGPQPRTTAPGEKVAIVVTVRAGDRSLLPGAKVTVAAGGGNFLTKAGKAIDPKDRGSHPNSVTGTTDDKGRFTTWWVVTTGPGAYVLGIEAGKIDYISGQAEYSIRVKP
jgi:hypothetical protein